MSFSLSRDGKQLAYASYSTRSNVWAVPIPTAGSTGIENAVALTTGSQTIEAMVASRDGRWIVYDSDIRGNADIFRVATSGGAPEQLTSAPWDEFAGSLSPDNSYITYHSFRTGTRDIEVKPLDGGPVEIVTASPAQESYPEWSPDGRSIAFLDQGVPRHVFVTTRSAPGQWTQRRDLGPGVSSMWMPDGTSVLVASPPADQTAQGGVPEILLVSPRDGTKRVVFRASDELPTVATRPRPSPDGRTIYLKTHDPEGRASFWAVPVAGGPPRLLVRIPDLSRPSSRADFAVDSERLYFTLDERHSDVFVAEVNR
jgi:Tol biopolymer transport system component